MIKLTSENKKRILDIISKDCTLRCQYRDSLNNRERTCVVGALALAAGVTPAQLDRIEGWAIKTALLHTSPICERVSDVSISIHNKFGIGPLELSILQVVNDSYPSIEHRRAACKAFIETL